MHRDKSAFLFGLVMSPNVTLTVGIKALRTTPGWNRVDYIRRQWYEATSRAISIMSLTYRHNRMDWWASSNLISGIISNQTSICSDIIIQWPYHMTRYDQTGRRPLISVQNQLLKLSHRPVCPQLVKIRAQHFKAEIRDCTLGVRGRKQPGHG